MSSRNTGPRLPERSSSPEPDGGATIPVPKHSKGKERMKSGKKNKVEEDSDRLSVHAESKHVSSSRRDAPIPTRREQRRDELGSPSRASKKDAVLAKKDHSERDASRYPETKGDLVDEKKSVSGGSDGEAEDETDAELRVWQFQGEGVPHTALSSPEGPLFRDDLERLLELDSNTLKDLDGLIEVKKPRLRAYLYEDLAFVYDPHTLQSDPECAFVAWSPPKYNHFLRVYVKDHAEEYGTRYHTFSFPKQQNSWWYLGYLEWQQIDVDPLWLRIGDEEKRILTHTLAKSWDCGLRATDIAEQFRKKELLQFSIKISRPNDFHEESKNFIGDVLENPRDDDGIR